MGLDTGRREAGYQEGVESKHEGEDCWEGPTNAGSARLTLISSRDTTMHLNKVGGIVSSIIYEWVRRALV